MFANGCAFADLNINVGTLNMSDLRGSLWGLEGWEEEWECHSSSSLYLLSRGGKKRKEKKKESIRHGCQFSRTSRSPLLAQEIKTIRKSSFLKAYRWSRRRPPRSPSSWPSARLSSTGQTGARSLLGGGDTRDWSGRAQQYN